MKVTLQRVRLNQGGYTDRGHYYGNGAPLYWYCIEQQIDGHWEVFDKYIRASDRANAKEQVRARFPQATFYR